MEFEAVIGLEIHAGHGLTYDNVKPIAAIAQIRELNIGHFLMGEILRQRNKAEDGLQALAHYHQALAADPLLPEPHKAIGLIHLEQGRALLARGFFEKALAQAPQAPDSDYIRSYLTQCIITIEGENP